MQAAVPHEFAVYYALTGLAEDCGYTLGPATLTPLEAP